MENLLKELDEAQVLLTSIACAFEEPNIKDLLLGVVKMSIVMRKFGRCWV